MSLLQSKSDFEEVFTVTEYYDGPRQGIANYRGQPHFYDCIFVEVNNDFSNLYRLTPVSQELFLLAQEDWAIWRRWERAFYAGEVDRDSHPALPNELDRHQQIQIVLDEQLKTDMKRCIVRAGVFLNTGTGVAPKGSLVDLLVKWSETSGESASIWAN